MGSRQKLGLVTSPQVVVPFMRPQGKVHEGRGHSSALLWNKKALRLLRCFPFSILEPKPLVSCPFPSPAQSVSRILSRKYHAHSAFKSIVFLQLAPQITVYFQPHALLLAPLILKTFMCKCWDFSPFIILIPFLRPQSNTQDITLHHW